MLSKITFENASTLILVDDKKKAVTEFKCFFSCEKLMNKLQNDNRTELEWPLAFAHYSPRPTVFKMKRK